MAGSPSHPRSWWTLAWYWFDIHVARTSVPPPALHHHGADHRFVEMGTSAWRARCPEMLDSGRATFVAHDFFTPQPPLRFPGASCACVPAVFLLRVITHDWPDSYVTKILLHLRLAAGPETKLLLADHQEPLPGTIRTLAPEDSPLLPNLGKANANAYWLDLTMRVMFNAQERTLREITALTLTAGWKVVQVTRAEGSVFGHITALPVEIPEASLALLSAPSVVSSAANSPGGENDAASAMPRTPEVVVKSPPMGDTFGSRVALPTDAAMSMRPNRRGKRATIPFGEVPAHAQKHARDPTVPKRRPAALSLAKSPDSVVPPKEHRDLAAAQLPTQSMLLPALEPELRHKSSISMLRREEAKVGAAVKAENGANGTRGLRKMQSRSQLGLACVTVEVHKGVAVQRDRVQVERLNLEED
ncbi:6-hydroxytryprostatin B O-methyltransferase [Grifola frondosa]|uniref:6-hydroxytryprostatin B O-methyltransferase n=1 Tax=Grifola frondosa TaxID=5627 RepID=A0A1C7MKR6_GRIFR|nr:6-hydroxytryprostatin B O-methyltransferase [Grifola frondosa]